MLTSSTPVGLGTTTATTTTSNTTTTTSSRPGGDHMELDQFVGVVEAMVQLGHLNLRDSARLFSRLCPSLRTAQERRQFLELVVTEDQAGNTIFSRNLTPRSLRLLEALGSGLPGHVVQVGRIGWARVGFGGVGW